MGKKYDMIREGRLFRIRAICNFSNIHKGDIGGIIQSEENLSQEGNCWIERGAWVTENAIVSGNAIIKKGGDIRGNAQIKGNAYIRRSYIAGNAKIDGNVQIDCESKIKDEADISGDVVVCYASVLGKSKICGDAFIVGYTVLKNAYICRRTDIVVINGIGHRGNTLVFYTCKDNVDRVRICVCDRERNLMLDEFEEYIWNVYSDKLYMQCYRMAAELAKFQIVQGFKAEKRGNK